MTKLSFVPLLFCLHLILWVSEHLRKPYVSIFATTFIWSALFSSLSHSSYLHCFLISIKTSNLGVGQTSVCHSVKKSAWILSLCSITILPLNSSDLILLIYLMAGFPSFFLCLLQGLSAGTGMRLRDVNNLRFWFPFFKGGDPELW